NPEPRLLARDPLRGAAARRNASIERDGELERQVRGAERDELGPRLDELACLLLEHSFDDLDPRFAQALGPAATNAWVRIAGADDDAAHARGEDRIDAGRRPALVIAGLERHVERLAARVLARLLEGH